MTCAAKQGLGERRLHYDQVNWDVVEPYQLEVRADLLNLLPSSTRTILDLGCGNGVIANALPAEWTVVGADISIAALRRLTRPACVASALRLPFADTAFDLVMANDLIEHLPDDEFDMALREIERVAKRYVVTTVPLPKTWAHRWNSLAGLHHRVTSTTIIVPLIWMYYGAYIRISNLTVLCSVAANGRAKPDQLRRSPP